MNVGRHTNPIDSVSSFGKRFGVCLVLRPSLFRCLTQCSGESLATHEAVGPSRCGVRPTPHRTDTPIRRTRWRRDRRPVSRVQMPCRFPFDSDTDTAPDLLPFCSLSPLRLTATPQITGALGMRLAMIMCTVALGTPTKQTRIESLTLCIASAVLTKQ